MMFRIQNERLEHIFVLYAREKTHIEKALSVQTYTLIAIINCLHFVT